MTAAKEIPIISVEDYLAGELASEVRHEYLGGYVYVMAGGTIVHNRVAVNFLRIISSKLQGRPCEPFNSDMKVRVRFPMHTRFYYPDAMVVCDSNSANQTFQDRPVLIAEVISDSTRRIDEGEKREAYLTIPTLSHYLLIETDSPRVVVHQRTEQGFVPRLYDGIDAVIPLEVIRAEVPLAEFYDRVNFDEPRDAAQHAEPDQDGNRRE